MHELSICESILQIMEEQAKQQNFKSIEAVCLEVGPLSGIEVEALKFSFDVVTRNTLADGCQLDIIETDAKAWCLPCAETIQIKERYDGCPICGSFQLQVSAGEELRIKEMKVN